MFYISAEEAVCSSEGQVVQLHYGSMTPLGVGDVEMPCSSAKWIFQALAIVITNPILIHRIMNFRIIIMPTVSCFSFFPSRAAHVEVSAIGIQLCSSTVTVVIRMDNTIIEFCENDGQLTIDMNDSNLLTIELTVADITNH